MDAVLSGRAARAIVLEDESVFLLDLNRPQEVVTRGRVDLRLVVGEGGDPVVLQNTSRDQIIRTLEFERDSACALDLALISLDPELSIEVRTEAVETLNFLFYSASIVQRVENTLYAKPLPEGADLGGAVDCCIAGRAGITEKVFERLRSSQDAILELGGRSASKR
jgi:hypothetical protein